MGSVLGEGTKIPHAVEQPSLLATTREPTCHNERSCMTHTKVPCAATKS